MNSMLHSPLPAVVLSGSVPTRMLTAGKMRLNATYPTFKSPIVITDPSGLRRFTR